MSRGMDKSLNKLIRSHKDQQHNFPVCIFCEYATLQKLIYVAVLMNFKKIITDYCIIILMIGDRQKDGMVLYTQFALMSLIARPSKRIMRTVEREMVS